VDVYTIYMLSYQNTRSCGALERLRRMSVTYYRHLVQTRATNIRTSLKRTSQQANRQEQPKSTWIILSILFSLCSLYECIYFLYLLLRSKCFRLTLNILFKSTWIILSVLFSLCSLYECTYFLHYFYYYVVSALPTP
jgi:hypothetical protein